jgi:hypothetical protein
MIAKETWGAEKNPANTKEIVPSYFEGNHQGKAFTVILP